MKKWRYLLGTSGIVLIGFGVFRLLTQVPTSALIALGIWLAAAVLIHDGILSPLIVAIGWALARVVPPRARRYVQSALIVGAPITIISTPLIYRRGSQPKSKALLQQDYGSHLTLVLAAIATITLLAYAVRVTSGRTDRT